MYRYLKYDDTDFCLEIAPITGVMVIKAKGSANYGPPCRLFVHPTSFNTHSRYPNRVSGSFSLSKSGIFFPM